MLRRIILAVIVFIGITLGCILLGDILVSINLGVAVTVGNFLKSYGAGIGILAGLWYFFKGSLA